MSKSTKKNVVVKSEGENTMNNFKNGLLATENDLVQLRQIDISALNRGEKSNEVLNYIKNQLILTAFIQSKDLTAGIIYWNDKSFSIGVNNLNLLSKLNKYKPLLLSIEITRQANHNCWKIVYSLNDEAITNNHREHLNKKYGTDIPLLSIENKYKEIDNNLLKNINNLCPVTLIEAGY